MCDDESITASELRHVHTHEREHTHTDGTTHAHSHTHASEHDHHHHLRTDESAESGADSADEKRAMLRYMLDHNIGHAEDLAGLSMGASDEVEAILAHALKHFNHANELLAKYIQKVEAE